MNKAHQLVLGSHAVLDLEILDINNEPLNFAEVTDVIISFNNQSDGSRIVVAKLTNTGSEVVIEPVPGEPGKATIALPAAATENCAPGTLVALQLTIVEADKKYTVPAEMLLELVTNYNRSL